MKYVSNIHLDKFRLIFISNTNYECLTIFAGIPTTVQLEGTS